MVEQVEFAGLKIAKPLYDFTLAEALPGTGIDPDAFWAAAASIIHDLAPKNAALLAEREALQTRIDDWHRQRRGALLDLGAYKAFLEEIGYLVADGPAFPVATSGVDAEIASSEERRVGKEG